MKRKSVYGFLLIFILSFNMSLIFLGTGVQPEVISTSSSNTSLMSTGINVTNSGDLDLSAGDPTNHAISWNLTVDGGYDYLGVYSFTEDADGSDPAGLFVYEEPSTNLEVIADLDGHSKVVELWDDSSSNDCYMYYNFTAQITGIVEFWIYGIAGTASVTTIRLFPNDAPLINTAGLYLSVDWTDEDLQYYDNPSYYDIVASPGFAEGVWHHLRFEFNCTTDTFDIWVDGTPAGSGLPFDIAASSVKSMDIATSSAGTYGNASTFIDAIDYSWAPGYYQNRNMDVGPVDYLGVYSFTDDSDGSVPANWTCPSHDANTDGKVINEKAGHRKVIELYDNNPVGYTIMRKNYGARISGTVEWWFYGTENGPLSSHQVTFHDGVSQAIYLYYNTSSAELYFHNGSLHKICDLSNEVWHHFRLEFNCSTNSFDIWVNGIQETTNGIYTSSVDNITTVDLYTGWASTGDFYVYFDAFDFSWAPGYYTNRNMYPMLDHSAMFSFTKDLVGADPAGWTVVEPSNTQVNVIPAKDDHNKVVEIWDNNGTSKPWMIYDVSPSQPTGTMEFWVQGIEGTLNQDRFYVEFKDGPSIYAFQLLADWDTGIDHLHSYPSIPIVSTGNFPSDVWHHLRIEWNCSSAKFKVWHNGAYKGAFNFRNSNGTATTIDRISFTTSDSLADGNLNAYIDAVDYSWAPGYYVNRNMDYEPRGLNYAVFQNGTRQTNWQKWTAQVQVDYNVSGAGLGSGVHNISLVYNDGDGNWYHDDVMVTVTSGETNKPNILSVTQNPTIPAYQENINITTRITEDSQVQTVYLESNHTGTFWNYSMTLLSGTLQDGVWNDTLVNWPANRSIAYRIFAIDSSGNTNSSSQSSFGYFDVEEPNIISLTQDPSSPTYQDIVNVTVQITDGTEIQSVIIETNYTGTLSTYPMSFASGTLQDGIWEYSFPSYPLNNLITYQIYATDVLGNTNVTTLQSFGVFDPIDPTIVSVTQNPENLSKVEPVDVTVRVVENLELTSVVIESNHTGSWNNYSMTLLNGTLQDGFWNYTIANWILNQSNSYRIIATDVVGRTAVTTYSTFGYFPIIQLTIISDAVDFDISGNRKCDVSIRLNNTGNTIWTNINVTIEVPTGWSADLHMRTLSQLAPGEHVIITYKLTAPETYEAEDLAMMTINITAEILETGQSWTDSLTFYVVGIDPGLPIWIWIIIIVGSAAAAATTSFVVVRKRRSATPKGKGKSFESLKWTISKNFPKEYSVLSVGLMERIDEIPGLTQSERELLIQDVAQLDSEEAEKWIDEFKKSLLN